jgi:HTH-type transcriptional regulator / antitoxin HipB
MQKWELAELPQVIRLRRKAIGLSQQELAEFAGCSRLFVSELERGKKTFQFDKFLAIIGVLGLGLILSPKDEEIGLRKPDESLQASPVNEEFPTSEKSEWGEQDRNGTDVAWLRFNLTLCDDEKLAQHQRALEFAILCQESAENARLSRSA